MLYSVQCNFIAYKVGLPFETIYTLIPQESERRWVITAFYRLF